MNGVRVEVGTAIVQLAAIDDTNMGGYSSQIYLLDELFHAVTRVVAATAADADQQALNSLLTAMRMVNLGDIDESRRTPIVNHLLKALGR